LSTVDIRSDNQEDFDKIKSLVLDSYNTSEKASLELNTIRIFLMQHREIFSLTQHLNKGGKELFRLLYIVFCLCIEYYVIRKYIEKKGVKANSWKQIIDMKLIVLIILTIATMILFFLGL